MGSPRMSKYLRAAYEVCSKLEKTETPGKIAFDLRMQINKLISETREFMKNEASTKKEKEDSRLLVAILEKLEPRYDLSALKTYLKPRL